MDVLNKVFNVYTLMYLLPVALSFTILSKRQILALLFIIYSLIIGLRHEVGGDWNAYLEYYRSAELFDFLTYLTLNDPGYMFINWISYKIGGGIYLVNLICGLIFMYGLTRFCKLQPNPILAMLVLVPYVIIVVGMGYTRQSVALGLVFLSLSFLFQNRVLPAVLSLVLSIFFHKTAIFTFIFLFGLMNIRTTGILLIAVVSIIATVLFNLFVLPHLEYFLHFYVIEKMHSEGGLIRTLMNAVPSILFLIFRNRMSNNSVETKVMSIISILSIMFVPLTYMYSTVADRLGLYLTPIQAYVYSRLYFLFKYFHIKAMIFLWIFTLYILVLLVWLNFGIHAVYWIPYKFGLPFIGGDS